MKTHALVTLLSSLLTLTGPTHAATTQAGSTQADRRLADYFRAETARLADRCLADIKSLDDWTARRGQYRQQLFEMLSLAPLPPRSDLKPVVTGKVEHEQFTVENLHFQSRPGLYVTANLYLPKGLAKPAPAILYLSGHGPVISNGISYGNKVGYQHHGAWFARNGYVCLVLDTLQLGEILGLHHGTYREGMWWWNARGYTPAGVEAWNSIRALDYLATRPEVDTNRLGVTGRSGGGAYSWWVAALDERIKAAAPVAGITDLQNHVVDGAVEGHCDCMFTVNTYRWDYPQVAALVAPRPLLLVNTDSDTIFPLDGVQRTHAHLRRLYRLHNASNQLGLVIGPGPHKDTQDLQVPVLRWFNKHLKGEDPIIETAAVKLFQPEQLKVFKELPADALNTNIHATFVPLANPPVVPRSTEAWQRQRDEWLAALREKVFAGWPEDAGPLELERRFSVVRHGLRFQAFDFTSQPHERLRLYAVQSTNLQQTDRVVVRVGNRNMLSYYLAIMRSGFMDELSEETATLNVPQSKAEPSFAPVQEELQGDKTVAVWFAPRGNDPAFSTGDSRKLTHLRRRYMLLGQTLDGMRVWDIRRAIQALRSVNEWRTIPLFLRAHGESASSALYASLFEPGVAGLELWQLPNSHQAGPDYLNALRFLDMPQAVAMAAERCPVKLHGQGAVRDWAFPVGVASALDWKPGRLDVKESRD
jgi:dienelactone hydrolase